MFRRNGSDPPRAQPADRGRLLCGFARASLGNGTLERNGPDQWRRHRCYEPSGHARDCEPRQWRRLSPLLAATSLKVINLEGLSATEATPTQTAPMSLCVLRRGSVDAGRPADRLQRWAN